MDVKKTKKSRQGRKFQRSEGPHQFRTPSESYPAMLPVHQRPMDIPFPNSRMLTARPERGIIVRLYSYFGFVRCQYGRTNIFFHYREFKSHKDLMRVGNPVMFTIAVHKDRPVAVQVTCMYETWAVPAPLRYQEFAGNNRQRGMVATRRQKLPVRYPASIKTIYPKVYVGTVDRVSATRDRGQEGEMGCLTYYDLTSNFQTILYSLQDLKEPDQVPTHGDIVKFQIGRLHSSKRVAVKILVFLRQSAFPLQGHITSLKNTYGFIENSEHHHDLFFPISQFKGHATKDLDIGAEVEYSVAVKNSKLEAQKVIKLTKGTIESQEVIQQAIGRLQGKVVRPMRAVDPDQDECCGLVQVGAEDGEVEKAETYPYSITSLTNKRDFLRKGDLVSFQVAKVKGTGMLRATDLVAQRKFIRAKVHSVKGWFGFLNYEAVKGKKLFFHKAQVHDKRKLTPGDQVEFAVVQNQRNGKYTACSIKKILHKQRPDKLKCVKKTETGTQIIRSSRGLDGRPREKILDRLAEWLKTKTVEVVLEATRDRNRWKAIISNAMWQGT